MMHKQYRPAEIEAESFRIITEELGQMGKRLPPEYASVILRTIHTTADFSYVDNLFFSDHIMETARKALLQGSRIVTDTNMALAGISKAALHKLGGDVICHMADADVAQEAARRQVTRAMVSMEKTVLAGEDLIYVIGNAPTALIRVVELAQEGRICPRFVIGAPVGFVHVEEAKELLIASGIPCIVPRGRKGGSNVAAAIINALLYETAGRKIEEAGRDGDTKTQ